jgi:hypothetical protein
MNKVKDFINKNRIKMNLYGININKKTVKIISNIIVKIIKR